MNGISEAVILLAGAGSRLRADEKTLLKPLVPVLGRPLISYIFDALAHAQIRTVYAVVGFEGEMLSTQLAPLVPMGVDLRFIRNPEWRKQNGVSVLCAAKYVTRPFVLTMSDHLFDQSIIDRLIHRASFDSLYLAIDRKIDTIFDLEDAMKVRTKENRIEAIGKDLAEYNAIDTGVFVCPLDLFVYLERAKHEGDCSLADGVRLMAADDKAYGIDVGDAWWQDIDTPEMLQHAERQLAKRSQTQVVIS